MSDLWRMQLSDMEIEELLRLLGNVKTCIIWVGPGLVDQ